MLKYGYKRCQADNTSFVKRRSDEMTILVVYVDDIIVIGNDKETRHLNAYLKKDFEIKDLGVLKYFLGIEVARSKMGIPMSKQKYTFNIHIIFIKGNWKARCETLLDSHRAKPWT